MPGGPTTAATTLQDVLTRVEADLSTRRSHHHALTLSLNDAATAALGVKRAREEMDRERRAAVPFAEDPSGHTAGERGADEEDIIALQSTVRAVCSSSSCSREIGARLEALSSVEMEDPMAAARGGTRAVKATAATTTALAQSVEAVFRPSFDASEKRETDLFRRVIKDDCHRVLAENVARTDLGDCHSCLTAGQHAAYQHVMAYYAQTGRTDYVKAVLAHQWPCADRHVYEQIACEGNGVFALFPDTTLVVDLMRAESIDYLRKLKLFCLTRAPSSTDAMTFRNPNYLQRPFAQELAQRTRREHMHSRVVVFLQEAHAHRTALESKCEAWQHANSTALPPPSQPGSVPEAGDAHTAQALPPGKPGVPAHDEEAFDFFEEEAPPSNANAARTTKPVSSKKPAWSTPREASAHIQNHVHSFVWTMDDGQFVGRYINRQVPPVRVVCTSHSQLQARTTDTTASSLAMTSHTHPGAKGDAEPVIIDRVAPVPASANETGGDSDAGVQSCLSRLVRTSFQLPPRWFRPRLQTDSQAAAAAVAAATPSPSSPSGATAPVLPTLSMAEIAALVSEVGLNLDMAALQALLKLAINPAGKLTTGVRLPVRVAVVPSPATASGARPVRLHVCIGRPFPTLDESRRDLTTAALTALLDKAVEEPSSGAGLCTLRARPAPTGSELTEPESTVPITISAPVHNTSTEVVSEVELHRAELEDSVLATIAASGGARPAKSAAAAQVSTVARPPVRIPFRVFTSTPWTLRKTVADGDTEGRLLFRLVKPEYLNAPEAHDGKGEDNADGERMPSSSPPPVLLESMSIDEAVELSALFHCFPTALVMVCRVNAYTGAVLTTDAWDATRWKAFLASEEQRERVRVRQTEGTSSSSTQKTTARVPEAGADALASAPAPLALSLENLVLLDHAWDCLFDVLDRLCLQLVTLCAQQLSTFDLNQVFASSTATHKDGSDEEKSLLLTLDYILAKSNLPPSEVTTGTPLSVSAARGGAGGAKAARRRLFNLALTSPDHLYTSYTVPYPVEKEIQAASFIQKPTLEACHQQYLPPANWPHADRIPFTFAP